MNKNMITALLFAIEGVFFFAFVMPQYRHLAGARTSLHARETLLQDTQIAQSNVIDLANQYTSRESTIAQVLLALPKQKQYDYLTESFQAAASGAGVELISINIGESQKGKGDYQTLPIKAELSGNYPSFLVFLDILEHSLRLYDITKVSIEENKISLQVSTYSLK